MRGDLHQLNLLSGERMAPLRTLRTSLPWASCEGKEHFDVFRTPYIAYVLNLGTSLEYWAAKVIFRPALHLLTRFNTALNPHRSELSGDPEMKHMRP
jgi:hypothetical protein